MDHSKLPLGAPFAANITVPPNVNFISLQNSLNYFSLAEPDQLKMIYAQSWVDMFWQPQQAFALARRTNLTPREGNALSVYRFPIPPSEVSYNQANWQSVFGASGDELTQKIWWMD